MAQAESITTAIRELMSRGRPPKSTSPAQVAHSEFVAALAGNSPDSIYSGANADHLDARAAHLENIFASLHDYLAVFNGDTAQNIPGGAPRGRLYRSLVLKFRPSSTSRRSASERDGLSGCLRAHASTLSLSAGENRIGIVSP
jgi:hypothetical protein